MLYSIQAANLALKNGKVKVCTDLPYPMKENLNALMYLTEPADAMLFLEGEHDLMAGLSCR